MYVFERRVRFFPFDETTDFKKARGGASWSHTEDLSDFAETFGRGVSDSLSIPMQSPWEIRIRRGDMPVRS